MNLSRKILQSLSTGWQIIASYAKIHLFSPRNEQIWFTPGTDLGISPTLDSLKSGIAICYDLRFPDLFRLYAKKGVQIILVPAAWPENALTLGIVYRSKGTREPVVYCRYKTTGTTPVDPYRALDDR